MTLTKGEKIELAKESATKNNATCASFTKYCQNWGEIQIFGEKKKKKKKRSESCVAVTSGLSKLVWL